MQPLSGNQRPDLLTSLINMSLVLRLPRRMHLCRSSSNVPRLPSFLKMLQNLHVLLTFDKAYNPLRLPRESTSERPEVVRTPGAFNMLTSKCASRHNGVHFFDISTAKSGPELVCFVYFDLETRFTPHRRALFRHLNFQKCSEREVLLAFPLANVLRATPVLQTWGAFSFSTCKCASRQNGVHFFDISTSKSAPTLRCFAHFDLEMCFAPERRALFRHLNFQKWSGAEVFCTFWLGNVLLATTASNFSPLIWPAGSAPAALASHFSTLWSQSLEKHSVSRLSYNFRAPASSFFWLFLFSDLLSSALLFSILLLHLCFSSIHIVGNLTSKLPSIIIPPWMYLLYIYLYAEFLTLTSLTSRNTCFRFRKDTADRLW